MAQMNYVQNRNRHREQTCGHHRRGMDWEFGVGRCELLCLKQITNKDLLYSTGNYIQHLVITYNGKESEAVHLKLTQYCKSTMV